MKKSDVVFEQRIVEIIADELCIDEDAVTPGSDLREDLGADALDLIELQMRLEEEFGVVFDDADAEKTPTVQGLTDMVRKKMAKTVAA